MNLNHSSHVSVTVCVRSAERSDSQGSVNHNVFLLTYVWSVQRIYKSLFMHKRDQISTAICTQNKNGIQGTHCLCTVKHKNWHLVVPVVNTVWTRIESICTILAKNQSFHLLLLKNFTLEYEKFILFSKGAL